MSLRERFSYLNNNQIEKMIKDDEKENYIERHTPGTDHTYNYLYFLILFRPFITI